MYDELVYHLDLCILSYQLYSQTLIWPMDPYYEEMHRDSTSRTRFMEVVRNTLKPPPPGLRGPGSFAGWPNNPDLDPIISDYDRINPWEPGFTRPYGKMEPLLLYNTPEAITDHIQQVTMVQYADYPNSPYLNPTFVVPPSLKVWQNPITPQPVPCADLLYCFEGGTGGLAKSDRSSAQYSAWSMMGFVLARNLTPAELNMVALPAPAPYDVHIAFRGSRSGAVRPKELLLDERGNPDWVTDTDFGLKWDKLVENQKLSKIGHVSPGFSESVNTMLPTVIECLRLIHMQKAAPPRTIYVTGHSLGGGLAGLFTSAVLAGTHYGPNGTGPGMMPQQLKLWPWRGLQLITFSAPVIGGKDFHDHVNQVVASRRVWLNGDPITQERRHYPIGKGYRIPMELYGKQMNFNSHEPYLIRRQLIDDRGKNHKFPTGNIPPIPPKDDQPWMRLRTLGDMLEHVVKKNPKTTLLKDFAKHLEKFLEILIQYYKTESIIFQDTTALKSMIDVISGTKTPNMQEVTKPLNEVNKKTNPGLYDLREFLGMCLVLAAMEKSPLLIHNRGPDAKKYLDIKHRLP